jgi:hypothetical protein
VKIDLWWTFLKKNDKYIKLSVTRKNAMPKVMYINVFFFSQYSFPDYSYTAYKNCLSSLCGFSLFDLHCKRRTILYEWYWCYGQRTYVEVLGNGQCLIIPPFRWQMN